MSTLRSFLTKLARYKFSVQQSLKVNCIKFCWLSIFILLFVTDVATAAPTHWRSLARGFEYAQLRFPEFSGEGRLHAFRIDLHRYHMRLAFAKDIKKAQLGKNVVHKLALAYKAPLAVNGGFFAPRMQPLGLRISEGELWSPMKRVKWWSVFFIRKGHAHIQHYRAFRLRKDIQFAVQAGPRLIVGGHIPKLKPGFDQRTALGITRKGRVILLVTEELELSTTQLARIMRRSTAQGGLGCIDALNLDGGSSTQLYVSAGSFKLEIPGFMVADAVLVLPGGAA